LPRRRDEAPRDRRRQVRAGARAGRAGRSLLVPVRRARCRNSRDGSRRRLSRGRDGRSSAPHRRHESSAAAAHRGGEQRRRRLRAPDACAVRMNADRAGPIARLLAEAGLVTTILWALLAGWRRDFRVPLAFSQDALEYLMQVKGTIENGWWWVHPRLSAPGEFKEVLYPSNTNVDQAIVWIVHLFTKEPGLVINVSWILTVALSAVIAGRCLTVLGVASRAAVATGILFALSPYALARNIDHFSLAIYLVPIPCTVALVVATERWQQLGRHQRWILTAGCLLLGLNYPYYAFFGSFLIVVASVVAYGTARGGRESLRGIALVALIATATALNLSPSVYAWSRDGRPTAIPEKHAAEAEQYGLKVAHLVS